jgi:hypothetical protein
MRFLGVRRTVPLGGVLRGLGQSPLPLLRTGVGLLLGYRKIKAPLY